MMHDIGSNLLALMEYSMKGWIQICTMLYYNVDSAQRVVPLFKPVFCFSIT